MSLWEPEPHYPPGSQVSDDAYAFVTPSPDLAGPEFADPAHGAATFYDHLRNFESSDTHAGGVVTGAMEVPRERLAITPFMEHSAAVPDVPLWRPAYSEAVESAVQECLPEILRSMSVLAAKFEAEIKACEREAAEAVREQLAGEKELRNIEAGLQELRAFAASEASAAPKPPNA